ncbi:MAG: bifunctional alpha,alpha-trehalose-phosphate synthase (UDP-forming)/trehalose-phosphatase [Eggerthellaceae bacterium]|jgi:trehalose 6-phosphate synthase/phosphatase
MKRHTIIVANRLPVHLNTDKAGQKHLAPSSGGLASALGQLHSQETSLWVGSSDLPISEKGAEAAKQYDRDLAARRCFPVYLSKEEQRGFYEQFANSVIWPLFHDFPQYARFDSDAWEVYVQVNRKFCDAVVSLAEPDDIIWVHDYHLLLLPQMLREKLPNALIGFFLHIPFPDYETFRMLPQRAEVLTGMLGADLVGFHTYDYVRHFLSGCARALGMDNHMGSLLEDGRIVRADVFSLGINYDKYAQQSKRAVGSNEDKDKLSIISRGTNNLKTMFSVGRLDYTKGVPELLRAYDAFLERYPEWIGRVQLNLIIVPSRESVSSYAKLKRSVDELVGRVNGKYAEPHWNPVRYYYRSLAFDELCASYRASDVMLVTPLRDGMNLVCKEYLAVHDCSDGVLVLSEMAGAAGELSEALLVNPFDRDSLVESMHRALTMPKDEQQRRNALMQKRLARYTSARWASEFLSALNQVRIAQEASNAHLIGSTLKTQICDSFISAGSQGKKRALLLDYDGTLVPFAADPTSTAPDNELLELLATLAHDPENEVVLLSGRDKETLDAWFSNLNIDLVSEHGAWLKDCHTNTWSMLTPLDNAWMPRIRGILQSFVDRTPGSLLEEKDYSLVWHYRACSRELAERRVAELRANLTDFVGDLGLQLAFGNKIVEIKPANVDKGSAAYRWFSRDDIGFFLVAGDDTTDEDMFRTAPDDAWTVKVGMGPTQAHWAVRDHSQMRELLSSLATCALR